MSRVRMLFVVACVAVGAAFCSGSSQALELEREALSLGIPDQEGHGGEGFSRRIAMSSSEQQRRTPRTYEPVFVEHTFFARKFEALKLSLRILLHARQLP